MLCKVKQYLAVFFLFLCLSLMFMPGDVLAQAEDTGGGGGKPPVSAGQNKEGTPTGDLEKKTEVKEAPKEDVQKPPVVKKEVPLEAGETEAKKEKLGQEPETKGQEPGLENSVDPEAKEAEKEASSEVEKEAPDQDPAKTSEAKEKQENLSAKEEEKTEEQGENKESPEKEDLEKTQETEKAQKGKDVLKEGSTLEVESLAKEALVLGAPRKEPAKTENTVKVSTFKQLKEEIAKANGPTTIIITNSFDIEETIIIGNGKDITITSGADRDKIENQVKPIGKEKIDQPKDSDSVKRRQELVKEAEEKGKKALEETDLEKHPLPEVDVVLKRAQEFFETLFKVEKGGKLTLGKDNKDPIFIDGNKDVKTELKASFIEVNGELVMNGGFIANGNNESPYSAPIYVGKGGHFTMNGGRITSNKNIAYLNSGEYYATGGVYIDEGGSFTLNAGSIDNNEAPVGGVFLGNWYNPGNKDKAMFTMNGGLIANNKGLNIRNENNEPLTEDYGGGVHVDSNSEFVFNNGIIAGNESYRGGGVAVNDNYVTEFDGVSYSKIKNVNYDDYIKYAGAYYIQNGGLIYNNKAKVHNYPNFSGAGGGIYINSSTATLNGGYLLNNKSENMGGGIYLSIAPHVLKLEHVLISQNKAIKGHIYYLPAGDGGGFWNCPVGDVNFEDFHSIYIFENEAAAGGKDIATHGKRENYWISNGTTTDYPKFLTTISPITEKGNIIKYLYNGNEVPEWMYNTDKSVYLQAIYDAQTKNEAWTNSKLFIMGNTALKGGGIGSNASIIPPTKPGDYEITINKKWHQSIPEDKKPDSIWVDLFIGDAKYGEVELSKDNGWTAKFENLPFTAEELIKKGIKYSIKERNDDFYSVVDEALKALEVERVFAGEKYPEDAMASGWDTPPHKSMDYKIVFIHKDKNGNEVSREDIKIDYKQDKEKWTGIVQDILLGKLKNLKNVKITYYGYDKAYEPDPSWAGLGYNGLTADSNWWDDKGPWHEAYILEKEDGTIEIQLPYLWTQYMGNPDETTDDYAKNTNGYRLNFVPNHRFTITNYPYSEIPVVKKWDKSIEEKDIPDSVKVYLLKDGERVKDKDGNDRYVILSKENGWKGIFDRLPYFELEGMGFEKYWVKEDSEIFIPLITRKENSILNIKIERDTNSDKYLIYKDYTGGSSRIKYIPFEVHYIYKDGDKEVKEVYAKKLEPYNIDFVNWYFGTVIKDIVMNGEFKDSDIEIKMYYDENGNPFPRNLGQYVANWDGDIVTNEGAYILKLVEENGKLVLYVPKLTDVDDKDNLLYVKTNVEDGRKFLEMTNYYLPKHRLEIEKIWDTEDPNSIPKNLKITIKGKNGAKEITLTPENWKYFEEILGKGLLSTNNYTFSEEDLGKFDGKQSIEKSLEFKVENEKKPLSFKDDKGNVISKETFLKLLQGKNYSFELKEAADDKAEVEIKYDVDGNLVIVYPVDVTITEVAHVTFTNTEKPEKPPEEPKEPPEEPKNPPEEPKTPPEEPKTPPEEPKIPSETPSEEPEKPVEKVDIPKKPQKPRGGAPQTYDPGVGMYVLLASMSGLGLCGLRKKKED